MRSKDTFPLQWTANCYRLANSQRGALIHGKAYSVYIERTGGSAEWATSGIPAADEPNKPRPGEPAANTTCNQQPTNWLLLQGNAGLNKVQHLTSGLYGSTTNVELRQTHYATLTH